MRYGNDSHKHADVANGQWEEEEIEHLQSLAGGELFIPSVVEPINGTRSQLNNCRGTPSQPYKLAAGLDIMTRNKSGKTKRRVLKPGSSDPSCFCVNKSLCKSFMLSNYRQLILCSFQRGPKGHQASFRSRKI